MARSARQIAAQRKAAMASARKRRGRRRVTKARNAKAQFHAKNRKKIQSSRKYKKLHLKEYKRTGKLMVDSGGKSRGWRKTMKALKVGGKHNVVYGKKLAKHNKKLNRAIARTR
jgi:hypothetical protein